MGTMCAKAVSWGRFGGSSKLLDLAATLSQVRGQKAVEIEADQTDWVRWEQEGGIVSW